MRKKQIKDIFTPKIIGVSPAAQIAEAMTIMRNEDISCVVVLEDKKPVGILTERNLVSFAARQGERHDELPVGKLMSFPVLTANRNMDIYEAYNLLFSRKIRHLVIVDEEGAAVGVVTQSNIVEHLSYDSFVEMKKVSQVMSKIVHTLPRDVTVQRALHDMSEKSVSCLVIAENDRPIGILTERDVARLLVEVKDLSKLTLQEVMSPAVKTVFSDTSLLEAVRFMKKEKLRRLVVVNSQGMIEGLATQTDVVKGLEGKYIERLNQIIVEKENVIQSTSRDLAEKTIYLDNILNSAVDYGIIAVDLDYRMVFFNPGAENVLGLLAADEVGQDVRDISRRNNGEDLFRIDEVVNTLRDSDRHSYIIERLTESNKQYISTRASRISDLHGSLLGYLFMFSDITKRKLTEEQLLLSQQVLEKRVQERTRELERTMDGAIQAMAMTVEMRDPYTSGHQRRVADLASAIAVEMGLPAKEVEGVYMAGLIHDIGKIRVPSGILCHPGRLGEIQFAIIKPHPEVGFDILKGIEFPWPVAEIVLQHHERMNGSGYPRALKGVQILQKARILAVADVVEAMSSHRPYRPALGIDLALGEITQNRGKYYDPDAVDACLQLFYKKGYKLPSSFQCLDG